MKSFLLALGVVALFTTSDLIAQDKDSHVSFAGAEGVSFDGGFRMRAESRDSGFNEGTTVPTRFRAGFSLTHDDNLSTRLQFQAHSDDLGEAVDGQVHQAYADLKDVGYFDVRLGRFEMNYGHGRMLSNYNFSNTGYSWDGFQATSQDEDHALNLFWTRPVVGHQGNADETLGGLYYERDMEGLALDAYALKRGTDARDDLTLGFIVANPEWGRAGEEYAAASGLGWSLEFATQSSDGSDDGSAMAASANYGLAGGIEIGVGLDTADSAFQPLYGDEFFYGGMANLFSWTNLSDLNAWVIMPMNGNWNLYVQLHNFSEDVATGGGDDGLGTELDAGIWGNLNDSTGAWVGLSQYSAGDSAGALEDQLWLAGAISVSF